MSETGTILSCATLSSTLPKHLPCEIERDGILNSIDDLFASSISLVRLDGKPDIGKTRVLRQFILRHPNHSFSVFVRPESWFIQDPALFYLDLATQMHWALHREELPSDTVPDEAKVRTLTFQLQKMAQKTNTLFYIVLDGVGSLNSTGGHFVSSLLRVLPTEYSQFRFLCSGDTSWVPSREIPTSLRQTLFLSGFSFLECSSFFEGLNLERSQVEDIYRNCGRGTPGYLASARRSLEKGVSPQELLGRLHDDLQESFNVEWHPSMEKGDDLRIALAILAQDKNVHSVVDLASILGVDADTLRIQLTACTFLDVPSGQDLPVTYVSDSFRRFAMKQLVGIAPTIWNRLADYYSQNESDSRVDLLPTYLQNAGRPKEMLRVLNPTSFLRIIEQTDSFIPIRKRCDLGLTTALSLKRNADVLRFQVLEAVSNETSQLTFAKAEVVARMVLDDYPAALRIAQTAVLKSQRLQLMAAIAKTQKENGLAPETTLIQAVELLVQQVQPSECGNELVEVASDLMSIDPRIALDFISRLNPDSSDSRSIDLALLRLATITAAKGKSSDAGMSAAVEDIQSRIENPSAQKISKTLSLLVVDLTAKEILRHARSIEKASDQLFLLREWCGRCKSPESAGPVIDYAIHLAIRTTEYLPSARDFRRFCEPLPFIEDPNVISILVNAFDIQKEAARNAGPIQDYVRWQLLLAEAEGKITPVRSGRRQQDVYLEVSSLEESDVKAVCLGFIVAAASRVDPTGAFDDTPLIREVCLDEFMTSVRMLMASTADHTERSRMILDAIAVSRPDLALQIIELINYESRRDEARGHLVESILDVSSSHLPLDFLCGILGSWGNSDLEDSTIGDIVEAIHEKEDTEWLKTEWANIEELLRRGMTVLNPFTRSTIIGQAIEIANEAGKQDTQLYGDLLIGAQESWNSIGHPRVKISAGYQMAKRLADHERELAMDILRKADSERSRYTDLSNVTYSCCVRLVIRAFTGLLPQLLDQPADVDRITALIERIPSSMDAAILIADLSLRLSREGRGEQARRLIGQVMKPALDKLKETCPHEWIRTTINTAPALYCFSPVTAMEYLKTIPSPPRDEAYDNILSYLLTKMPTGEPFKKGTTKGFDLDYERSVEILTIVDNIDTDWLVYKYIEDVAESARWKHNKYAPTQQQKNELARMIRALSNRKFPNLKCIQHEGFAILAEAHATSLLREKSVDWKPYIERADSLNNFADRAFVQMFLAEIISSRFTDLKRELFDKAYETILRVPSRQERIEKLRLLASTVQDTDSARSKALLTEAAGVIQAVTETDFEEPCRRLVDQAYQLDPEFASSLSSALDKDGARRTARERISYNKKKADLREGRPVDGSRSQRQQDELEHIAADLLGSLNANRVAPKSLDSCLELIKHARGKTLYETFWSFSWTLENLIQKRGASQEAKTLLRDVFEGLLSSSEVASAIISRAAGRMIASLPATSKDATRVLIKAGQREKAVQYMSEWLMKSAESFLYICDPYFGMMELEALQMVLRTKPELRVLIITSKRKQNDDMKKNPQPLQEAYLQYWKKHVSDQDPPDSEVIVIGNASGDLPIHDRWWLSKSSGLRTGTSFNQLGVGKDSELSLLTDEEFSERLQEMCAYINREKREHMGEKLTYEAFSL